MNFLLQMIGRSQVSAAGLRPTGRRMLINRAGTLAAGGNIAEALCLYKRIALTAMDTFICGHLELALGQRGAAAADFGEGIDGLLAVTSDSPVADPIDYLLNRANLAISEGRYSQAIESLEAARSTVEILLSATGGLHLAIACGESKRSLVSLARLGDLLLRMLARTHLAGNLAETLRIRELREDVAAHATTGKCVNGLLTGELEHLQQVIARYPEHAESHYRLALIARALGRFELAANSFGHVLKLHPHHTGSAVRLAATRLELESDVDIVPVLEGAFTLLPEELERYHALARAAADAKSFDHAVSELCNSGGRQPPVIIRANLAFALAQLSLLDEAHAGWREPAAVGG